MKALKVTEAAVWGGIDETIRHGNLEVPNILARLPTMLTWPKNQERKKKISENEILKYFPAQKLPVNRQINSKHPKIEKINWRDYSMMKNIRSLNRSPLHSAAFSSPIEVRDGDNQVITSVQGVGLVVKNRNRYEENNSRIVNNMVEYLIGKRKNRFRPKQSLYNSQDTSVRLLKNQITSNTNREEYNDRNNPNKIFRINNYTPGPGQRIRTWRPNLVGDRRS